MERNFERLRNDAYLQFLELECLIILSVVCFVTYS